MKEFENKMLVQVLYDIEDIRRQREGDPGCINSVDEALEILREMRLRNIEFSLAEIAASLSGIQDALEAIHREM